MLVFTSAVDVGSFDDMNDSSKESDLEVVLASVASLIEYLYISFDTDPSIDTSEHEKSSSIGFDSEPLPVLFKVLPHNYEFTFLIDGVVVISRMHAAQNKLFAQDSNSLISLDTVIQNLHTFPIHFILVPI
jgi:hypothetical protein